MAIRRVDDGTRGVVSFEATGSFSLNNLRETLTERYHTHPSEQAKHYFWDLGKADLHWSAEEIQEFADWVRENRQPGRGRTAVVVAKDLHFGLARMCEVLSSDLPVEFVVFRDFDAAPAWVVH
jgi:hypothetical protein